MAEPSPPRTPTAAGRLLVLDDDPSVGQILVAQARASGFEARLCGDVAGFLAALVERPPTHLALDLTLPGSSGLAVLQQLARLACTARILICSGAAPDDLAAALQQARALGLRTAGVLAKPYRLATLRALLHAPD